MSFVSNVKFEDVNPNTLSLGLVSGEIQARMECMSKTKGNQANYRYALKKYEEMGIVNSTPSVVEFMRHNPRVFKNPKLISARDNIFEEFIALSPLSENSDYDQKLKNRMTIGHELTSEEMEGMDEFLQELHSLPQKPDVQEKVEETRAYKRSIERLWGEYERPIMEHVEGILGYVPENVGKVSIFVMYPNYDIHKSCQLSGNRTFLFLGKRGKDLECKTLANITHQAVHQPMIPYKMAMSKQSKENLHAFIKFLTDKEIYTTLSGKSGLAIITPKENHELMGKVYPYWLGYKHRNDTKMGLDPTVEIAKEIQRDKSYYDSLKDGSSSKKRFSSYRFESLDPQKIAEFFRYRKGITPYEFAEIDFNNRDAVSYDEGEQRRQMKKKDDRIK